MNITVSQLKALKFYIGSTAMDIELNNDNDTLRVRVEYPASTSDRLVDVDTFSLDKSGIPIKEGE